MWLLWQEGALAHRRNPLLTTYRHKRQWRRRRNADGTEQKYWANLEAGHGHWSLPLKLSRCPTRCAAERKNSEIQGSYKPKQLSPPRQPSPPRQNEPSKVRRKGNGSLEAPMGQRARRSPSHRSEASLPRSPTGKGEENPPVPPWRGSWFNNETTLKQ